MEIKQLNLTYTEEDFNRLKERKELREKQTGNKIKWEDFIIVEVLRR